jgi:hypothetical protein
MDVRLDELVALLLLLGLGELGLEPVNASEVWVRLVDRAR